MGVTKSVKEALSLSYTGEMYKKKLVYSFIKRFFDIVLSLLALIILFPVFLVLIICVKCDSKGPAFYGHIRVGENGKKIKVWKFRSMIVDQRPLEEILTPEQMEEWKRDYKITNDPRVTKVGKFLRKTSLDELPQLVNILCGQMAICGWRPILDEELERYTKEEQNLLLKTKPGLTGFWASHGRSDTTYEERIKMELYYAYKRNLWLDIRIIWHTVVGVSEQKGAK